MYWQHVHKGDYNARLLADRHYSRQKVGSALFTRPGNNIVLLGLGNDALWVSQRPAVGSGLEVRMDGYQYWNNSHFRNESQQLASCLIEDAIGITLFIWGKEALPSDGLHTFIDPRHVKPIKRRGVVVWGWVYRLVGFEEWGITSRGLIRLVYNRAQLENHEIKSPAFRQLQLQIK